MSTQSDPLAQPEPAGGSGLPEPARQAARAVPDAAEDGERGRDEVPPTLRRSERWRRPPHPSQVGLTRKEADLLRESAAQAEAEAAALRKQVETLRRLQTMSRQLSSILDAELLFDQTLDFALALTGTEKGLLILEVNGGLEVIRARDAEQRPLDSQTPFSQSLVRECLRRNDAVRLDDAQSPGGLALGESVDRLRIHSAICVPLQEQGVPIGVLYLVSSRLGSSSTNDLLPLLSDLACQASIAVANARRHQSLEQSRQLLTRENEGLRAELRGTPGYAKMVGSSPAMARIYDKIRMLKDTDVSVLIEGESGTGKELVARALHEEGRRRDGRFVAVNCSAFPPDLLESTMFGYCKGAFSGAAQDTPGLVEAADGGTLLLDEISDLPMTLQPKLLRFLEGGEFRRVGEQRDRTANVRVLSATNVDLLALTRQKRFRLDLYFRLAVVKLELPPLRERREDLPLLIDHLLRGTSARTHRSVPGITEAARLALMRKDWREGNVRELRNVLEGAAALAEEGGVIDLPELEAVAGLVGADPPPASVRTGTLREESERFERELVLGALERRDWNVSRAAADLRISRQHLHNLIRRFELTRPRR